MLIIIFTKKKCLTSFWVSSTVIFSCRWKKRSSESIEGSQSRGINLLWIDVVLVANISKLCMFTDCSTSSKLLIFYINNQYWNLLYLLRKKHLGLENLTFPKSPILSELNYNIKPRECDYSQLLSSYTVWLYSSQCLVGFLDLPTHRKPQACLGGFTLLHCFV